MKADTPKIDAKSLKTRIHKVIITDYLLKALEATVNAAKDVENPELVSLAIDLRDLIRKYSLVIPTESD